VKIALVHKRLDLNGGTERDLYQTTEGLRDLGHEVHLFCSEYPVPAPRGVVWHRVPVVPLGRTLRLWSFAFSARKLPEKSHCDVVVNFGRMFDADVLRCGGGTHRGFLRRMGAQGGAGRRLWQSLSVYHRSLLAIEQRQFHSSRVEKIIAVSELVKNDILANYTVPPEKIAVLYNGVDPHRFHPGRRDEFRRSVREQWKIPLDAPLVLFVGSGFRRKGLDRLIRLWRSRELATAYLLVIGSDARIRRYRTWGDSVAPGKIVFTGRQDEIEKFYAAADVAALPSRQEAFGNVVLEALASGVPVLVSRDAGAAEVLTGGLAQGIVDRADDPPELRAKLLSLIDKSNDPVLAKEARRIGEKYSWDNHFRALERLLLDGCIAASLPCAS
jgi:UDP-glucose:(heptosyl)LPS alpha-1,3-glucosyltransferase